MRLERNTKREMIFHQEVNTFKIHWMEFSCPRHVFFFLSATTVEEKQEGKRKRRRVSYWIVYTRNALYKYMCIFFKRLTKMYVKANLQNCWLKTISFVRLFLYFFFLFPLLKFFFLLLCFFLFCNILVYENGLHRYKMFF